MCVLGRFSWSAWFVVSSPWDTEWLTAKYQGTVWGWLDLKKKNDLMIMISISYIWYVFIFPFVSLYLHNFSVIFQSPYVTTLWRLSGSPWRWSQGSSPLWLSSSAENGKRSTLNCLPFLFSIKKRNRTWCRKSVDLFYSMLLYRFNTSLFQDSMKLL